MILCFSAVFAGWAFELQRACLHLEDAKPTDEASAILWHWLLKQIRLSETHAALHDIYARDCAAIFYDLNSDGEDEIIGTHYSTALHGNGECLLYVLKKKDGKYREITGEEVYFDIKHPICILLKKNDGFRNIQVFSDAGNDEVTYVFNKSKGSYYKKVSKQK